MASSAGVLPDVKSLGIILMCVGAAVCYGIAHDQVTARVCVEYFTVGHPRVFNTDNPTLLGIGWGIGVVGGIVVIVLVWRGRGRAVPERVKWVS